MEVVLFKVMLVVGALNALSWLIPDATWEKTPTWVKALLRILRSIGPDTVKGTKNGFVLGEELAKGLRAFLDAFRGGPPMTGALVLALALTACTPQAQSVERYAARGSVLTIAYAAQTADEVCYDIASEQAKVDRPSALALAMKCDHGYEIARKGLLFAAHAVDAWDAASKNEIACAVSEGVAGLREIVSAVEATGAKLPGPMIEDALRAADELVKLGGECRLKP